MQYNIAHQQQKNKQGNKIDMNKLFKTITSIFSSKVRKANRKLQISNCIDLIDNQQFTLAQAYKKLTITINDLEAKLKDAKTEAESEQKPEVKAVKQKNAEIIETTLARLKKSKETIAAKLQKTEDSRVVLVAKKSLLDSIESLKGMTSNCFETADFDVDAIMAEIDKTIRDIESEFQADDELNELAK